MKGKVSLKRLARRRRVRARIFGTAECPRISVFRSNRCLEVQLIDDAVGRTIIRVAAKDVEGAKNKTEFAYRAGELAAQRAKEVGVKRAVFDRRHYKYHGRVKAVAEGARAGGLKL
jgi:large subunit ribosomal protein L18